MLKKITLSRWVLCWMNSCFARYIFLVTSYGNNVIWRHASVVKLQSIQNPIVSACNPNGNNIFPWFFPLFSRTLGHFQSNLTQSIVFKYLKEHCLLVREEGGGVIAKYLEIYPLVTFHKSFFPEPLGQISTFADCLGFYAISAIFQTCNGG